MKKEKVTKALTVVSDNNKINSVFADATALQGYRVKSLAPLLKLKDWPLNAAIAGTFEKTFPLPAQKKSTKKTYGIEIAVSDTMSVAVPAVACIEHALEINAEGGSPYIGKEVAMVMRGQLTPKPGQRPAWNVQVGVKQ